MGRARDMMARYDQAAKQKPHRRQDGGSCPAVAPVDCQRQSACCPLSSECVPMADGGTGCVISNAQGQTLTLTPLPKQTPTPAPSPTTSETPSPTTTPSTLTTVPVTETTSTTPAPVPTITDSTTTPTTLSATETSASTSSVPIGTTTTQSTASFMSSLPGGATSSTDSTLPAAPPTTLTSISTFSSSSITPGAIGAGPTTPSSPSNTAKGANLNKGQTIALIAAPVSAILLAILAYFMWRRRKATRQTPEAMPLSDPPPGGYADDDEQPITDVGLSRAIGSTRSAGSQPSMATTDILLRGSEDGRGPLRSHPVTMPAMMLGAIPQSPMTRDSDESSFKSAAAKPESEESSGSSPILAPFGQEYLHGHVRYSSSPMRYVTRLDEAPSTSAGEAPVEGSQPSPSAPQMRHMSWMMNPFGRSSSSVPSSPRVVPPSDWITPMRRPRDERVVSMPSGDGGQWEVLKGDEKGSL